MIAEVVEVTMTNEETKIGAWEVDSTTKKRVRYSLIAIPPTRHPPLVGQTIKIEVTF